MTPDPRARETALSREQMIEHINRLLDAALAYRLRADDAGRLAASIGRELTPVLAALAASLAPLADAREMLAALAHEQWTGWMRYLFSRTTPSGDGALIPAQWVTRWQHQMDTPYERLSERDKDSDRKEADRVLAIIAAPAGTGTCGECAHWVAAAHASHVDMCCLNPKAMAYQRVTTPRDGCRLGFTPRTETP
jgi:hypothetical protein